jgi:osmotically-inducible protein OsmY
VKLSGAVGTTAEKRRAVNDAWVAGATDVDAENLTVDRRKVERLRCSSPYVRRSDADIEKAIEDALLTDPRVDAYNPDVAVVHGAVTLSGTVEMLYAKQAAADDARNTTGVWKMDNQLKLGYRAFPLDEEIKRMIEGVVRRDAELHSSEIDVAVKYNHVRLTGSVSTMGQKVRAENIIQRIDGVVTLYNQISVNPKDDPIRGPNLKAAIQDDMFWSPYVESDRITVTVQNRQAILEGNVPGQFMAHTAVKNTFEGGAKTVRTNLVLDDGSTMDQLFKADTYQFRLHRLFDFRP